MESSSISSSSPDNPDQHSPPQPSTHTGFSGEGQGRRQSEASARAGSSISAEIQKKKHHKMRPYSACIPCRNRKVKCDRLTPCDTCTSRGIASECQYMANDEDRYQMAQAEVIAGLRAKVRELKSRVASADEEEKRRVEGMRARVLYNGAAGGGVVGIGGEDDEQAMRVVYEAIRRADAEVAWRLVETVRDGRDLNDVARLARGLGFVGEG